MMIRVSPKRWGKAVAATAILLAAGSAANAQRLAPNAGPQPVVSFPAMDIVQERENAEVMRQIDGMNRFAVPHDVSLTPLNSGSIEQDGQGTVTWTLTVETPNALNINFGTRFDLPPSARITFINALGQPTWQELTAADNQFHGELWTPIMAGRTMTLSAQVDEDEWIEFAEGFEITRISLGFMGPALEAQQAHGLDEDEEALLATTLNCNIDVACSQADPWDTQVRSVIAYAANGFLTCSGALVNNTALDRRTYILTAWHCINGGSGINFNSIVVSFNFQNSFCRTPGTSQAGGPGNDSFFQQTLSGAQFRMSHGGSDTALFEMNQAVPDSYNAEFIGWNRGSSRPSSPVIGIHHPNVEEKRISIENSSPNFSTFGLGTGQGSISGWGLQYDQGVLEGGSSGSPLFDSNGQIVGVASGVSTFNCGVQQQSYGRFDVGWSGGGSNSTRLSNWLDPIGQGVTTLGPLSDFPDCFFDGNADSLVNAEDIYLYLENPSDLDNSGSTNSADTACLLEAARLNESASLRP